MSFFVDFDRFLFNQTKDEPISQPVFFRNYTDRFIWSAVGQAFYRTKCGMLPARVARLDLLIVPQIMLPTSDSGFYSYPGMYSLSVYLYICI